MIIRPQISGSVGWRILLIKIKNEFDRGLKTAGPACRARLRFDEVKAGRAIAFNYFLRLKLFNLI
ncbi:MAG: hypothetical protein A3D39_04310 [Candidatus Buchananbacteria bacterium RIFCSPHIGHO2_02_FULL_39_17]|uniref:Uncharacterized protein n=1 Tax=Candidatus Buchananbacteria bacterium RIFCSPLOWO2_01_FULL_40_23b TaxID=1797544 RepID=A0A1G1YNY9_9BACT|nr:MAG: hypothetical protein A3D39_04310 [Candidatus Buchananbacteria bacterium RIFCSPHIGHO2_02_FULL_39_17]OGY54065.1 MAG: hypothetical protein A2912_01695 [Candidatus Buchananbacteria bacterium RIFCSPLOWO2_01_FULL_40_23b]